MQKSAGFILNKICVILLLALLGVSTNANAEGKGSGEAYVVLEPFTVNLVGLHQVIQLAVTLKPAKTDMTEKIKVFTPAIRNDIIFLLSGKTAEELHTSEGKQKLIVEIRKAANKAIGLTAKDGISDALIESFIIQ